MLTLNASQKTQNMLLPAVEFLKTFRTFRIHDGPDCKHRLWWHWWRLIGCLHWNPIHCPVFTLPPSDSELYQAHPQWYYSWPAPNWFCKHFSCIAQKSPSTEASKCCSHTWLSLVASLSGESMCDCEYLIWVYGIFYNVHVSMMGMWHIVIGKEWTTPPTMQLVAVGRVGTHERRRGKTDCWNSFHSLCLLRRRALN